MTIPCNRKWVLGGEYVGLLWASVHPLLALKGVGYCCPWVLIGDFMVLYRSDADEQVSPVPGVCFMLPLSAISMTVS